MSKIVSFHINNKKVLSDSKETILQSARREGIYIPTLCYLSKVNPIASCRMCIVEIENESGLILSCQSRVKDGMRVKTNSEKLYKERQNIMQLYDVNHPLECGVCDKSGECELQNKTAEFNVSTQTFMAKEKKRDLKNWGIIQYDESLCIVCEKCVHVCNEVIGDSALMIQMGGYNSKIVLSDRSSKLNCSNCGECIAVCPVGALISNHFKYTSNSWELKSINSSCSHCSSTCHLFYDVKHETSQHSIYRVKNDFEFSTLCGAGRFAFNFANKNKSSKNNLLDSIRAFKRADTIKFTSLITNEEALILQKLKDKFGYRLINQDAFNYKNFLNHFSRSSLKTLYDSSQADIEFSDIIVILGSIISSDMPSIRHKVSQASKSNGAEVVYAHPIEDYLLSSSVSRFLKYEPGSEEGILALLLKQILNSHSDNDTLLKFFENMDDGYISSECNISEDDFESFAKMLENKDNPLLILGSDLYAHPRAKNLALLAGLIQKHTKFKVLIIPSQTNTLGVSLICDLDEKGGDYTIGYNTKGDFILSALGDGDMNMPSLNQQEGTFTNIDKRVVPINVAIDFKGYFLNDIANELGIYKSTTVDYTKELPLNKGYSLVEFDKLKNHYDNSGKEVRGYLLKNKTISSKDINTIEDVYEIDSFDGLNVYLANPINQFNQFTAKSNIIQEDSCLRGSLQFANIANIKDKESVFICFKSGIKVKKKFCLDEKLKGTIAILPTFNLDIDNDILSSIYRYIKVKIRKIV